jgi:predicted XRE-type DNA-binding protein
MPRKRARFSDEIRAAVEQSGMSRYAISKTLGIPESSMSRFMTGENWLGQEYLDALAELLDLHVSVGKRRRKKSNQ